MSDQASHATAAEKRSAWLSKLNTSGAIGAAAFLLALRWRCSIIRSASPREATWLFGTTSRNQSFAGRCRIEMLFEIKSPVSAYLSAGFIAAGKLVGVRDILATRLLQVLLLGSLSMVTYLVAEAFLLSRLAAVIAFLITLLPEHLATMIAGTQPKLADDSVWIVVFAVHRERQAVFGRERARCCLAFAGSRGCCLRARQFWFSRLFPQLARPARVEGAGRCGDPTRNRRVVLFLCRT